MKGEPTLNDSSKVAVPWLVFIQLVIAGEVLVKRLHRWRILALVGWALALVLAATL